jgi:hypothetical protein
MDESVKMRGQFEVLKYSADGRLVDQRLAYNTVTTIGKAKMAGLLLADCAATATAFDNIAIGTGTGAGAATQVALTGEIFRTAGVGTLTTSGTPNDTAQLVAATITFTGAFAVGEAGVFDSAAATVGNMLARAPLSAVLNVTSGDSLVVTYKITMV